MIKIKIDKNNKLILLNPFNQFSDGIIVNIG